MRISIIVLGLASSAWAAPKIHVLALGKWNTVQWSAEPGKLLSLKIRPLYLDGRLKEFTFGPVHDVTERLFVVRRAFRVNDSLPPDSAIRWEWQPGGWLLVDRTSGHITAVTLTDFDPYYSTVSWYRDYVAYCGISDDGKKLFTVVSQVGSRKAILRKAAAEIGEDTVPGADCPMPVWQRAPSRVTFWAGQSRATTYSIRRRAAEVVTEAPSGEAEEDTATE